MKRLLISHVDLDGTGSPVIAKLYFSDYFDKVILRDYGFEEDPEDVAYISSFDEIIIADLSAPEEFIDSLVAKGISVTIYDHHIHASWLNDKPYGVYDENRCGTRIFWEEWARPKLGRYNPLVDHFVELVDTYDRWQQDSNLWNEAKALNAVLYNKTIDWDEKDAYVKFTPFIDRMCDKIRKSFAWFWTNTEKEWIMDAVNKEKAALDKALSIMKIRHDYKGRKFGVTALGSKISLVCSTILDMREDLDYVVCLNLWKGLNGKLSFRSKRKDLDLNEFICCAGHAQATGGTVIPELAEKFFNDDSLCWAYRDLETVDPDVQSTWLVKCW